MLTQNLAATSYTSSGTWFLSKALNGANKFSIVFISSLYDVHYIIGLDDDDCENFLVGDEGLSVAVNESRM